MFFVLMVFLGFIVYAHKRINDLEERISMLESTCCHGYNCNDCLDCKH